jgi:chromosome segregation ATPase
VCLNCTCTELDFVINECYQRLKQTSVDDENTIHKLIGNLILFITNNQICDEQSIIIVNICETIGIKVNQLEVELTQHQNKFVQFENELIQQRNKFVQLEEKNDELKKDNEELKNKNEELKKKLMKYKREMKV